MSDTSSFYFSGVDCVWLVDEVIQSVCTSPCVRVFSLDNCFVLFFSLFLNNERVIFFCIISVTILFGASVALCCEIHKPHFGVCTLPALADSGQRRRNENSPLEILPDHLGPWGNGLLRSVRTGRAALGF